MLRAIICGGRDFSRQEWAFTQLDIIHELIGVSQVIEGGARGADSIARAWARERGIPCLTERADWDRYGRRAGYLRNLVMAEDYDANVVIAAKGGKGTEMMKDIARRKGIPVVLLDKVAR